MRYPKYRKSPIHHTVHSHTRLGRRVSDYTRGKGSRVQPTFIRKRRILKKGEPKPFTINFKYSDRKGDGESVIVISTSYEKALDEAFEERKINREPVEIEIIDPDFGRVFRAIGSGLSKLGHIGAKYAVKGGHIAKQAAIRAAPHVRKGLKLAGKGIGKGIVYGAKGVAITGKVAAEEVGKHYRSYELNKLIRDCYDEDRVRRTRARSKLSRLYPDVYDVADFSKDRPHVARPQVVRVETTPQMILVRRRTLIRLRTTLIEKGVKVPPMAPRKEQMSEEEKSLRRQISWAQANIRRQERKVTA